MSYIIQNGAGTFQPIEVASTVPQHQPGTEVYAVDLSGNWGAFIYLRANTTINKGSNVVYDSYNWSAAPAFFPAQASGLIAQAALIGVPAGYWAWFMLRGSNLAGASALAKYNGYPVASFTSINDINSGFSSGTYSVSQPSLYSGISIQLTPAASGGTPARATVDLSGALASNSLLQAFDLNKLSTIGLLVKVLNPVALDSSNGTVFMYMTAQSNRIQANWFLSGGFTIDLDRGGWFFLTLNTDRNGFVDTNGVIQQGFIVDGNGSSNIVNSASNLVNSVRFDATTMAVNNTTSQNVFVDSLWLNPATKPTLMLHFDDGYNSQYSEAAMYMGAKGLRGTIGVVSGLVGTNGYMTK